MHQSHHRVAGADTLSQKVDRQLVALIGNDALRKLNKDTKNALLLADLVKEAA